MEIKVEIDNARIMKKVLDGMTTKEIEDEIVQNVKSQVIEKITRQLADKIDYKYLYQRSDELVGKELQKTLEVVLKKEYESHIKGGLMKWVEESKFEDLLSEWLWDTIDNYFSEGINVSVRVGKKGKKDAFRSERK